MPLNARDNRLAREQARAKAAEPPPLNPPFPYVRQSFDPFLFKVQNASPVPAKAVMST